VKATCVPVTDLDALVVTVRSRLIEVSADAAARGMPRIDAAGRLIRPLIGYAAEVSRPGVGTSSLWRALAAVQYAHEASLMHDDIIDDAVQRRGRATQVAKAGVKGALVLGDHLLTSAYRLAAESGSLPFVDLFAHAVERTVAGETMQGKRAGEWLDTDAWRDIVLGKSGELLGCALAAGSALRGDADAQRRFDLGRRLGLCYQMVDDFLDFMSDAGTGKPPYQDWAHGYWTWPLEEIGVLSGFDASPALVERLLHATDCGTSAAHRCLCRLDGTLSAMRADLGAVFPGCGVFGELLSGWSAHARRSLERTERSLARRAHVSTSERISAEMFPSTAPLAHPDTARPHIAQPTHLDSVSPRISASSMTPLDSVSARMSASSMTPLVTSVDGDAACRVHDMLHSETWSASLARYARSFSFAARWFPRAERRRTADVYAVCRFTDEIADRATANPDPAVTAAMLDAWRRTCRDAYDGVTTGFAFIDRAMTDAHRSGVSFDLFEDLVAGVAMDTRITRYETYEDLSVYTYRVASVVGIWMTRLFGVPDAYVLERAASLGHAMQLTNILRDVGEDLDRGRVYIPMRVLRDHDVSIDDLHAMRAGAAILPAWSAVVREVMRRADAEYERAFEAVPALPLFFQRPVAVAANVYRGIHREILLNGCDTFTRRAYTSAARKAGLAFSALVRLGRERRRFNRAHRSGVRPRAGLVCRGVGMDERPSPEAVMQ
jgi:15-cis-phytoene synthase